MPIVFIHGAGTRQHYRRYNLDWQHIESHLRDYVAPVLSLQPEHVPINVAYWGDVGVRLAWQGSSRPPATRAPFKDHPLARLMTVGQRRHVMREAFHRSTATAGYWTSNLFATLSRQRTTLTSIFIGDALYYLATRGTVTAPGAIVQRVLDVLDSAYERQRGSDAEPLVVFTHSLGSSIFYDIVTHFLPQMPRYRHVYINYWVSVAAQVGLFEEMKLYLASNAAYGPENPVPFPDRSILGGWWNVWDPHDLLSSSVAGIIEGVDDDYFDSGLSVGSAHMSILKLSSFYVLMARKLTSVLAR
jgi:hypothetical protein